MPDSPLPAYVDTRRVFQQQGQLQGTVSLERLPRFREVLASDQASVQVELAFSQDESGTRLITGSLRATVEVTCQRCLEPLAIELADSFRLALLADEAAAGSLEPSLDPWICADIKLQLAEMVEEQLMLCMPIVNYHPQRSCPRELDYTMGTEQPQPAAGDNGAEHPFAALKALKKQTPAA